MDNIASSLRSPHASDGKLGKARNAIIPQFEFDNITLSLRSPHTSDEKLVKARNGATDETFCHFIGLGEECRFVWSRIIVIAFPWYTHV